MTRVRLQVAKRKVVVCVPWSPESIDNRDYDFIGLSDASDLVYVMGYDVQSAVFDRCIAQPNSPLAALERGVQLYVDVVGVSLSKLILGIPWYGYVYKCTASLPNLSSALCPIEEEKKKSIKSRTCSDSVGTQKAFSSIRDLIDSNKDVGEVSWDDFSASAFVNYVDANGTFHQIWFDPPEATRRKALLARKLGLRGIGPYTFDDIYPDRDDDLFVSFDDDGERTVSSFWAALRLIKVNDDAGEHELSLVLVV
eukprot:TRINITY_DN43379_c0_g1_i10.p1 TRINITY_DN43379_c0_g1~~TRINITY_DN43379_c0_g1_i10.p1  ORF type:complete len:253 (+),score=17.78 TRINITY_DN43379_c0_g1_i10:210-968(+)